MTQHVRSSATVGNEVEHPVAAASIHAALDPTSQRSVLVVAHPGHELRVHGWMEAVRPQVFVLTDGSGSRGEGRIDTTTRVLARMAARAGSIYGRMSDRAMYAAILGHEFQYFNDVAEELAHVLVVSEVDCVVGDAIEGYNPCHDVCRLVINAAIRLAGRRCGLSVAAYDFAVVGAPDACPAHDRPRAVWFELDEDALTRKLDAARSYRELADDVTNALARFGTGPFRTECLRPVDVMDRYGWNPAAVPFYESYGEQRVAAGLYDRVLRFREHVMPLADALWSYSEAGGGG